MSCQFKRRERGDPRTHTHKITGKRREREREFKAEGETGGGLSNFLPDVNALSLSLALVQKDNNKF